MVGREGGTHCGGRDEVEMKMMNNMMVIVMMMTLTMLMMPMFPCRILYGGSVTAANCRELAACKDIDGNALL